MTIWTDLADLEFKLYYLDANFNGTTEGEQFGILQGARFLAGC